MIFQIYNERGDIVFNTTDIECLPNEKDVQSMAKASLRERSLFGSFALIIASAVLVGYMVLVGQALFMP